jgi:hypothetical protein
MKDIRMKAFKQLLCPYCTTYVDTLPHGCTKEIWTKEMKAIIKFNNGVGALLCNGCSTILKLGTDHDRTIEHLCAPCNYEKYGEDEDE